jgi:hypothetical protein
MSKREDSWIMFVVAALLTYFIIKLVTCDSTVVDGFCLCNGIGQSVCQDSNEMKRLYTEGKVTEYTIGN